MNEERRSQLSWWLMAIIFVAGLGLGYLGDAPLDDDCARRDPSGDCILTDAEEASFNEDAAYDAGYDEGYDGGYLDGYERRVDPCQNWQRQAEEAEADIEFWSGLATPSADGDGDTADSFSSLLVDGAEEDLEAAKAKIEDAC